MRESVASLVLFERRSSVSDIHWLLQWNQRWKEFSLIGGHLERNESVLDCGIREVKEELGLAIGIDYCILPPHEHNCLSFEAFSESAKVRTAYSFYIFLGRLCASGEQKIAESALNYWASRAEISEGKTTDRHNIARQVQRVLSWQEQL